MSASREGRRSELTFGEVLTAIRSLTVEVWIPRVEDAQESAERIKFKLDQMIAEMKAEAFSNPAYANPNEFDDGPRRQGVTPRDRRP